VIRSGAAVLLGALCLGSGAVGATLDATIGAGTRHWAAEGGTLQIRFNRDLLRQFGADLVPHSPEWDHRGNRYPLRDDALELIADWGTIRRFERGALTTRAGFTLVQGDRREHIAWFAVVPAALPQPVLEIRDAKDRAWFIAERLMYRLDDQAGRLSMPTVDLRIGPALAAWLGRPDATGQVVADLSLDSRLLPLGPAPAAPKTCAAPQWHGTNGKLNDVRLVSMTAQQMRCRRSDDNTPPFGVCDGPSALGGADDGEVVLAPSATLRNSDTEQTADVPWYEKFLGAFPHQYPPYNNDQHPILVWNLYRLGADGRMVQIGRSGAKHAWFSTNFGCNDPTCSGGHILGRACADEYTASSNDSEYYLAPRSEIIPARGIWGRCGSIFDDSPQGTPGCDGVQDFEFPSASQIGYAYRLVARESALERPANDGARWFMEAWYVVRDDIDIFNTMGWIEVNPVWGGGQWNLSQLAGGMRLGPAIDAWVAPGSGANERSETLATAEGQVRVAVRVTPVGGRWRYDYAVMNLDFARALTEGAEPNLRVLDARGFGGFVVPLVPGGGVSGLSFADADANAGNDWSMAAGANAASFTAPAGANTLDWGTLFRFSLESSAAPVQGEINLVPARAGSPASFGVPSLVPGPPPLFADGFE
jgi:hypothetical protein